VRWWCCAAVPARVRARCSTCFGLLARPDDGVLELRIGGRDALALGRNGSADFRATHIGFVFQSFNLLPHLTALENITLAIRPPQRKARAAAGDLLVKGCEGCQFSDRNVTRVNGMRQAGGHGGSDVDPVTTAKRAIRNDRLWLEFGWTGPGDAGTRCTPDRS
jgi:hypothetical protein